MEAQKVLVLVIFLTQQPGIKAQDCGVAPLNTKIVGGENATEGFWPWQVSIHYLPVLNAHICGGTIINKEWVLTAAHCIIEPTTSAYRLYFGKQTQSGSNPHEEARNVAQIIVHPDYDGPKFANDIALMKLSSPLSYTDYIRPVCLAANSSLFHNGTTCWGTGWGRLSGDAPLVPHDVLQQVQIPVIGNNLCGCYYKRLINITSNMVCAGELGKGTCQGDSGGPVQCKQGDRWIQAGITSFGISCAIGFPEVFARVSYFQSWITEQTAGTNVSFVSYTSPGTDADSSFVCPVVVDTTAAPSNSTTPSLNSTTPSLNSTTPSSSSTTPSSSSTTPSSSSTTPSLNSTSPSPGSRAVCSELAFAGSVIMILLMPLFA